MKAGPLWPFAAPFRIVAAFLLSIPAVAVLAGFGTSLDAGFFAAAEPAYAAQVLVHPTAPVRAVVARAAIGRRTRVAGHGAVVARKRDAASATSVKNRRVDPTPIPSPLPSAPPAQPQPEPTEEHQQHIPTVLNAQSWRLTADGTWTTVATYALPAGVDPSKAQVAFSTDAGDVLPVDSRADTAPGAIITIDRSTDVNVRADVRVPALGSATLLVPAPRDDAASFAVVAKAVGPHLIDVGWTPLAPAAGISEYKVYRRAANASVGKLLALVSPSGHTWQDASAQPAASYIYSVVAVAQPNAVKATAPLVTAPPAMPATSVQAASGKGMFLYFSPSVEDANGYDKYDPDAVVERAKRAGITHIELRMARGTFFEASNDKAAMWLDEFIDKANAAGIALLAWQVPRRATTADVAQAVLDAAYRTPAGNGFSGLALDIEDGDNYMGWGEQAKQQMVDDIRMVRQAVGPEYLVVATVISPKLTHWTNKRYPYDRIAPYASVMQPMEYWHHFFASSHHAYTQDEVSSACADSVSITRSLAGRDVPINVAGQSDDLGTTGPPAPDELVWCLTAAKSAGAIGQTFFDWRGTDDPDWAAIAGFSW